MKFSTGAADLRSECRTETTWQPDSKDECQAANLVLESDALADQLLAGNNERANRMRRQRLHMDELIEAGAGKMRQTPRIVAISLVGRERLQCLVGVTALDAHDGQAQ